MSRIGNRELTIPANVTVSVNGNVVSVKGPKGELSTEVHQGINVKVEDNKVICTRTNDNYKNFHGTANANIKNMIVGVTEGFEKIRSSWSWISFPTKRKRFSSNSWLFTSS